MMVRPAGFGVLICVVMAGCGRGPSGTLEGDVTVDGQPVQSGTISFTPFEAGSGTAVTAEVSNGRYQVRGAPTGRVRVLINARQETGNLLTDPDTGEQYPETISLVPDRYMTTGVEITISEGAQTHDFELTP